MRKPLVVLVLLAAVAGAVAWFVRERDDESGWREGDWFEAEGEGVVRAGPPVDAPEAA